MADISLEEKESQHEQRIINEEYKLWRKNVPFLYDLLLTHALSWPSLSVQWFPDATRNEEQGTTTQRLLLSTHTSKSDDEFLNIVSVTIPDKITESTLQKFQEENEKFDSGYGDGKFKVIQEIPVINEINKTRYCPFAVNVIAARSDSPETHIYDYTKHLSKSKDGRPDLILKGHNKGGYGLSWSSIKNAELITSGDDSLVCLYDINMSSSQDSKELNPLLTFNRHTEVVGDCCFNFFNGNVCVSVGDDKQIIFWDTRTKRYSNFVENAHDGDIFCVNFSPLDENILATGSKDSSVKVWDMRKINSPEYTLLSHKNDVLQVQWSPHYNSILASSGVDRRVCIWDLSKVGEEITEEEALDGPPELAFLHGGHTNTVCDFAWNPLEPMEIASVAEDNIIQVWQRTQLDASEDVSEDNE